MTDHNLFQEVQEEVERQKLIALWKKFGFWIVLAAVGIVVSTASSTGYRTWKARNDKELTTDLLSATSPAAEPGKNIALLKQYVDKNAGKNHADLALLRAAALALEAGDKPQAIGFFDALAANKKADPALRQLGDLLSVQAQLDDGDAKALSARLQPLTEKNGAWRFSALEAQALLALRAGDAAKAKQIYTELSQDADAPKSLARRAQDVLRTLN